MTTNVPRNTWGNQGFAAPDEFDLLNGFCYDWQLAFNNELYLAANDQASLSTPQGQIAFAKAQIKGEVNDALLFLSNQFNPHLAQGVWQDGMAKLYELTRQPAQSTVVDIVCSGLDGTVIAALSKVRDVNGEIYINYVPGTIVSGTVTIPFYNVRTGPIPCNANTVTEIYKVTGLNGWDSCSNPTAGVTGNDVESRAAFEARRFVSVMANAQSPVNSLFGKLANITGVIDIHFEHNPAGTPKVIGDYTLKPHSVYFAIVGGADASIISVLGTNNLGCDYNGNTTGIYTDNSPYFTPPYPTYEVAWHRPDSLPIKFSISITAGTAGTGSISAIKAAVIATFNGQGLDGKREKIGGKVVGARYYSDVLASVPGAEIISIYVGTTSPNLASVMVPITSVPTITESDIQVLFI